MLQPQTVHRTQGQMTSQSMGDGDPVTSHTTSVNQANTYLRGQVVSSQNNGVTQAVSTSPQSPPVIQVVDPEIRSRERYMHVALGVGYTQVVVGLFCICINILAINMGSVIGQSVGYGFWNGVFFIIIGCIGIGSGCANNTCMIVACMVLCIISATIFAPSLVITASVDTFLTFNLLFITDMAKFPPVALLLLGVLEFCLDIAGAVICGHSRCCCQQEVRRGIVWPAGTSVPYMNLASQGGGETYPQQPQPHMGVPSYATPMAPAGNPPAYTPMTSQAPQADNPGCSSMEKY